LFCQNPINVIQSHQLDQILIHDTIFQKFSGDVIIEYSDFKIQCDTILIDEYQEIIRGWGNTSIFNDTINCQTDSINIKQFENKITFYTNSILETDNMLIYSDHMIYNYEQKKLAYLSGGSVKTQDYAINSQQFTYQIENEISEFKDQIQLTTNKYKITTNHMIHENDIINFVGKNCIKYEEFTINSEKGIFKKDDFLKLYQQESINGKNETIISNQLFIDISNEKKHFTNNVHVILDEKTHIFGDTLIQQNQFSNINNNCEIQLLGKQDSIYITGDIIQIDGKQEEVEVINNVFIMGKELEGSCNNMLFKSNYENILMNKDPVIWIRDIQITGKRIELYTQNNNVDSIYIPINPFIVSPNDSLDYYNQMTGNILSGKFKNNKVEYINLSGNAQMIYFDNQKNKNLTINMNHTKAGSIKLIFDNNKIKNIFCVNQIESNYNEINLSNETKKMQKAMFFDDFNLIKRRSF
tara:strand:- start:121 stop:1527 length:1407 start_codon:yes stop_codon:yes gene_type:complete